MNKLLSMTFFSLTLGFASQGFTQKKVTKVYYSGQSESPFELETLVELEAILKDANRNNYKDSFLKIANIAEERAEIKETFRIAIANTLAKNLVRDSRRHISILDNILTKKSNAYRLESENLRKACEYIDQDHSGVLQKESYGAILESIQTKIALFGVEKNELKALQKAAMRKELKGQQETTNQLARDAGAKYQAEKTLAEQKTQKLSSVLEKGLLKDMAEKKDTKILEKNALENEEMKFDPQHEAEKEAISKNLKQSQAKLDDLKKNLTTIQKEQEVITRSFLRKEMRLEQEIVSQNKIVQSFEEQLEKLSALKNVKEEMQKTSSDLERQFAKRSEDLSSGITKEKMDSDLSTQATEEELS